MTHGLWDCARATRVVQSGGLVRRTRTRVVQRLVAQPHVMEEPLRRHYATLSGWHDEAALDGFVGAYPHDELMTSLDSEMGVTKFVRWTISGAKGLAEPAAPSSRATRKTLRP